MTISVAGFDRCVCSGRRHPHRLCDGELAFEEKGKKIRLSPKSEEDGVAIVLDGCVFDDDETKCDGLFLWKRATSKKCAILVELKGAHDIEHAFEQIAYVRGNRPEYRKIVDAFRSDPGTSTVLEKAVIVSNGMIGGRKLEKYEEQYGIRVRAVLDSDATTRMTDVRDMCC